MFSCGYHKESEIRCSKYTYENVYYVWVYDGIDLMEGFMVPMKGINEKKKDSVNALADKFISDCEMLEK